MLCPPLFTLWEQDATLPSPKQVVGKGTKKFPHRDWGCLKERQVSHVPSSYYSGKRLTLLPFDPIWAERREERVGWKERELPRRHSSFSGLAREAKAANRERTTAKIIKERGLSHLLFSSQLTTPEASSPKRRIGGSILEVTLTLLPHTLVL